MSVYSDIQQGLRNLCITSLIEFFPTVEDQDNYVYFSHDNGPEPDNPYVVINILGITQQGKGSHSTKMNSITETISSQAVYEVSVQFTFCGSSSGDMAQTFTQAINNNHTVIDKYRQQKLGVLRKSNIRRVPQKRETQWVEYLNQDITFSYAVVTKQSVDVIESVIVEDKQADEIFTVPEGVTIPD